MRVSAAALKRAAMRRLMELVNSENEGSALKAIEQVMKAAGGLGARGKDGGRIVVETVVGEAAEGSEAVGGGDEGSA